MVRESKKLRIRFCPTCKSFNVRYIHTLGNLFGVVPKLKCMDCGAEASTFPIMEVTQKELDKKNKEVLNKSKKSGGRKK